MDDHRDDATVWAWFANESPLSAKGRFSLARVMIARGDRANAERLVREAWRNDSMSEDTENAALDLFGALLTPGDHKARMDFMLYGSEQDVALRAAKRLGAQSGRLGQGEDCGLSQGIQHPRPCSTQFRTNCTRSRLHLQQDPVVPPRREIRRGRPAHAQRAQGPSPSAQSRRMVDRTRLLSRKMLDVGEHRTAYLIARDAALPARDIYKNRAGIHGRLDCAALF